VGALLFDWEDVRSDFDVHLDYESITIRGCLLLGSWRGKAEAVDLIAVFLQQSCVSSKKI
jgi:hypothetical protein